VPHDEPSDAGGAGEAPSDAAADTIPPSVQVDAAEAASPTGRTRVLLRVNPPHDYPNGTILMATLADAGALLDVGELVKASNEAGVFPSRYGLRRPTMSPNGKWMVVCSDRWSSSGVEYAYVVPVPGYQKEVLRVAGGPGLSSPFDVEEPAVIDDTGNLVVFEAKVDLPVDGGVRAGRWLYKAVRSGGGWGPATLLTSPSQPFNGHDVGVLSADGTKVLSSCSIGRDPDEDHFDAICETSLATGITVPLVRAADRDDAGIAEVSNPSYAPDGSIVFVADNWPPVDNRERIWRLARGQLQMVSRAGDKDFNGCALPDGTVAAATSIAGEHKLRILSFDGTTRALFDYPGAGLQVTPGRSIYCVR
jgi:hypothetical protein